MPHGVIQSVHYRKWLRDHKNNIDNEIQVSSFYIVHILSTSQAQPGPKLRSTRVRNTSLDSMGFSTNDSSWIESWVFVARDDCSIISLLFHVPLCPCCIQASNLNLLISFHGVPFARLWKGSFFECHFCNQVAFSNGFAPPTTDLNWHVLLAPHPHTFKHKARCWLGGMPLAAWMAFENKDCWFLRFQTLKLESQVSGRFIFNVSVLCCKLDQIQIYSNRDESDEW